MSWFRKNPTNKKSPKVLPRHRSIYSEKILEEKKRQVSAINEVNKTKKKNGDINE